MNYLKNEDIRINNTGEIKRIKDFEKIENINVIYTTDGYSYADFQVSSIGDSSMNYVCEMLLSDPYKFLNRQKTIESCEKWFSETEILYKKYLESKKETKKRNFWSIF